MHDRAVNARPPQDLRGGPAAAPIGPGAPAQAGRLPPPHTKPSRRSAWRRLWQHEGLNFVVTNRVPRWALTHLIGWYAGLRSPLLTRLSIAVWRLFTELDLSESPPQRYASLQACFTRPLLPGARPVEADPAVLVSPCDAIVGACGPIADGIVLQAKGMPYALADLVGPAHDSAALAGGSYLTLRLTSAMYHRFHAPHDAVLEQVSYLRGDVWNVNPPALKRIAGLYRRNERAVLQFRLANGGQPLWLVPVAAILVASIRLHAVDVVKALRATGQRHWRPGTRHAKGEELGWFEHGSTVIVFAPPGFVPADAVHSGARIRMGQALLRRAQD